MHYVSMLRPIQSNKLIKNTYNNAIYLFFLLYLSFIIVKNQYFEFLILRILHVQVRNVSLTMKRFAKWHFEC